ncbi:MAG: RNA polymerase sigma-70 factor [Bacteroidales bacterium]|jgi:RNA polymerase sigma-70 factor (ECF subfamily)
MSVKEFDYDIVLIKRLINSDVGAFEIIYHRYSRELFFLSMAYLNNVQASEDIIQEAFIYLWKNRENLSVESILCAYLRKIVKNMSLNCIRHNKIVARHSEFILHESDNCVSIEDSEFLTNSAKENEIKIRAINKKLNELPSSCRKIFIMSVIDELSYKDVSKTLGLSVNTIKTQVKIAYKKMRQGIFLLLIFLISAEMSHLPEEPSLFEFWH